MGKQYVKQKVTVIDDKGYLAIQFYYNGQQIREYLKMKDTPANYKYAKKLAKDIGKDLNNGTFFYTNYFDNPHKALLFEEDVEQQQYIFKDYANIWIQDLLNEVDLGERKRSGVRKYEQSLNKYILPLFGKMPLNMIRARDIKEFKASMIHLDPKTRSNHFSPLRQILDLAVADELIEKNPMPTGTNKKTKYEKQMKYKKKIENQPYSAEQVLEILTYIQNNYPEKAVFFACVFFTGMRIQEALAMKWKYLDMENWTYNIVEAISEGRVETPKTLTSVRTLGIIKPLRAFFINQMKYSFGVSEYVLTTSYGGHYKKQSHLINRQFYPALKALGFPQKELRSTRHIFTTISLQSGESKSDIRNTLGHTTYKMIDEHYELYVNNPYIKEKETKYEQKLLQIMKEKEINFEIERVSEKTTPLL